MNPILRWGAYATFLGFLLIGLGVLFGDLLSQASGWIALAVGIPLSFIGLDLDIRAGRAAQAPAPTAPEALPTPVIARKAPKAAEEFVCSDCGGDITKDMKVCPHCGAKIED